MDASARRAQVDRSTERRSIDELIDFSRSYVPSAWFPLSFKLESSY